MRLLVLAFVLGRMVEESLRQSLLLSHGHFDILLKLKRLLGTVGEETGT